MSVSKFAKTAWILGGLGGIGTFGSVFKGVAFPKGTQSPKTFEEVKKEALGEKAFLRVGAEVNQGEKEWKITKWEWRRDLKGGPVIEASEAQLKKLNSSWKNEKLKKTPSNSPRRMYLEFDFPKGFKSTAKTREGAQSRQEEDWEEVFFKGIEGADRKFEDGSKGSWVYRGLSETQ